MQYITRPMRMFSERKLRDDFSKLTVNSTTSLMKHRIHVAIRCKTTSRAHTDVCIVAKNKFGKYIGWACLWFYKRKPRIMVFVSSPYRKKGIGSKLLSRAVNYFHRRGYRNIYAEPWSDQAEKFFCSRGFIEDPKSDFFNIKLKL